MIIPKRILNEVELEAVKEELEWRQCVVADLKNLQNENRKLSAAIFWLFGFQILITVFLLVRGNYV